MTVLWVHHFWTVLVWKRQRFFKKNVSSVFVLLEASFGFDSADRGVSIRPALTKCHFLQVSEDMNHMIMPWMACILVAPSCRRFSSCGSLGKDFYVDFYVLCGNLEHVTGREASSQTSSDVFWWDGCMMGDVRVEWFCGRNQVNLVSVDAEMISMATNSSYLSWPILPLKGKMQLLHKVLQGWHIFVSLHPGSPDKNLTRFFFFIGFWITARVARFS